MERGNLVATFTVDTNGTEVRDCRIVRKSDGSWFFTGPQREYDKDGKKQYFDLFRPSDSFRKRILDVLQPHVEPPATEAPAAQEDDW